MEVFKNENACFIKFDYKPSLKKSAIFNGKDVDPNQFIGFITMNGNYASPKYRALFLGLSCCKSTITKPSIQ
jgi:hypothetical protein